MRGRLTIAALVTLASLIGVRWVLDAYSIKVAEGVLDPCDERYADIREHLGQQSGVRVEWRGSPVTLYREKASGGSDMRQVGTNPFCTVRSETTGDEAEMAGPLEMFEIVPVVETEEMRSARESAATTWRDWAARLGEDFPFPLAEVAASDALATFERARTQNGTSPVVLGTRESLERLAVGLVPLPGGSPNGLPDAPATEDSLASAMTLRFPDDYDAYRKAQVAAFAAQLGKLWQGGDGLPQPAEGPWPGTAGQRSDIAEVVASLGYSYADGMTNPLFVASVPTDDPAEIPAYLRYGAWNAYPPADHHVAALRSWQDRYGARLVAMTSDMVVLKVDRPVTDRSEALSLAREMYSYCPDTVEQGAGTLQNLAASLTGSEVWTFWWD